ncbi:MAG TPA: hypothetical protein PK821_00390 [Victivallales bacterium]|nr:hypothetical protein [Victivallales bacterium]
MPQNQIRCIINSENVKIPPGKNPMELSSPDAEFDIALNSCRVQDVFGHILVSSESVIAEIEKASLVRTSNHGIGTLFNFVFEHVKETGRIDFLLKFVKYKGGSDVKVIEILRRIARDNIDLLYQGELSDSMSHLSLAFQVRFALKNLIQACQILKKYDVLQWAEDHQNEIDKRIYLSCHGSAIFARFAKLCCQDVKSISLLAEMCSWGVLGGCLAKDESVKAMTELSTVLKETGGIGAICGDSVGLLSAADCVIGRRGMAFNRIKKAFLAGSLLGNGAWTYHSVSNFILGIKPEYYGLRIYPCIPDGWGELSIRRFFRGRRFEIKILRAESLDEHSFSRITLNGRSYDGDIINAMDFLDENKVQLEIN